MICWRKQVLIPFNLLLLYVLFRTSTSQLLFCTYNYFTVHIFTMRDTTYKLTVENNLLGTILQTLLSNLTIISDHATYIPFHETQQKKSEKERWKTNTNYFMQQRNRPCCTRLRTGYVNGRIYVLWYLLFYILLFHFTLSLLFLASVEFVLQY